MIDDHTDHVRERHYLNGQLAQTATLVSYGTLALNTPSARETEWWRTLSSFKYVHETRFVLARRRALVFPGGEVVATTPNEWLQWCESRAITRLKLAITLDGECVIRADDREDARVWRPESRFRRGVADDRPWKVTYRGVTDSAFEYRRLPDVQTASDRLSDALAAAARFSSSVGWDAWAERFTEVASTLRLGTRDIPYHPDLLVPEAPVASQALAAAASKAWVFGGSGSWDDVVVSRRDREAYRDARIRLYDAVVDGIAVSANLSSSPGEVG